MEKMTLYGIRNCDKVRKVRRFLEQYDMPYDFIDIRVNTPDNEKLSSWLAEFGEELINKRSTTYREYKEAIIKALAQGDEAVLAVLREYPTLIKRPVIEVDGKPEVLGWQEDQLMALTVH